MGRIKSTYLITKNEYYHKYAIKNGKRNSISSQADLKLIQASYQES